MINNEIAKALSDAIIGYINNRRDKKEESFLKDKPKKNRQGAITKGAINTRLVSIVNKISQNKEAVSSIEKSKKNKEQTALYFQKKKYEQLLSLIEEDKIDVELLDLKSEYQEFLVNNNEYFKPEKWLTLYANKAKDISFATHVGKLTHSSSKSSSILDVSPQKNDCYLTTNSLQNPEIDTASSNAASLPIADILKINTNGISVLDCLKNNDKSPFEDITEDKLLVTQWCEQLKQAYDSTQKKSYFLSKQTYFPIADNQYHLLLPLTSSSLVHELHLEHKKYWDEEQDTARAQRKDKKYSAVNTCTYPKKAYLHVTGSNHSNASSLNGKRGGRISLLSTMPPQWKPNFPSYINKVEIFDKKLAYELKTEINELKKYLLLIKNKELTTTEPKRNAAVMNKLQAISGNFFNYVGMVNNHTDLPNWTCDSHLPIEQQLLFEPYREDDTAKMIKINKQWQKILSKSYGRWLNNQLKDNNKLPLSAIHAQAWADAFSIELREFIATQEVTI